MLLWILCAVVIGALGLVVYWKVTAPSKPSALAAIDNARKGKSTGQGIDGGSGRVAIKSAKKNLAYLGELTLEEIAKHKARGDCWIILDGMVYDVTTYVDLHPGGDAILNNAGTDSSVGFHGDQHPTTVANIIPDYCVGVVKRDLKD